LTGITLSESELQALVRRPHRKLDPTGSFRFPHAGGGAACRFEEGEGLDGETREPARKC
jgi:hypothetical protein